MINHKKNRKLHKFQNISVLNISFNDPIKNKQFWLLVIDKDF